MSYSTEEKLRKVFSCLLAALMLPALALNLSGSAYASDQTPDDPVETSSGGTVTIESSDLEVVSPYLSINHLQLSNGTALSALIINGSPTPPAGHDAAWVDAIEPLPSSGVLAKFPSFSWVYGCSAVSGAMIAAYYDRHGYDNIYTGPTNNGVMPLTDTSWSTWNDGSATYPSNPLIASRKGVDGLTARGSINDYWVKYGSTAIDPYITNGWSQHAWGTSIGDYMKTSQSAYDNTDGATSFYNYTNSNAKLTCSDMVDYEISDLDGTYGRKLFYQARGYAVTDCFNQPTDNKIGGGFSLANFKAEVDSGNPVLINLAGHSIVGYGYDGSTIYIRDTWDNNPGHTYTMPWGGSYDGMKMLSVSIVHLAPPPAPTAFAKISPADGASGIGTSATLSWEASSNAYAYEYCYDTTDDGVCSNWLTIEGSTSVDLADLLPVTTYYWQVRANGWGGTTYANGSESASWSFSTQPAAPGNFSKIRPADKNVQLTDTVTLSWDSSDGAVTYEYCLDTTSEEDCSSWVDNGAATSVDQIDLTTDTSYYWQVRAVNPNGVTYANDGQSWSFVINGITPRMDDELTTSLVTFNWSNIPGATKYKIQLSTKADFSTQLLYVSTPSSDYAYLTPLTPATTYYWRVRPVFGTLKGSWSETYRFTSMDPLTAPALDTPGHKEVMTSNDVTFTWLPVTNAAKYQIQVARDLAFTSVVTKLKTDQSTQIITLPNGKYFWRVRAIDASGGKGPWSGVRIVKVSALPR
ncbi:MAG: hypothetical protein KBG10_02265 [Anaerolineaceae bacterium]|nr:hypothetical protein [Anaerolineaceae bacterium]